MTFSTPKLLAATALSAASVIILRAIWRKKSAYQLALSTSGWLIFLIGVIYWAEIKGWEIGLAYHFAIVSLVAWLIVTINLEVKPRIQEKQTTKALPPITMHPSKAIFKFLIAGPVAGLSACIVLLALSELMPINQTNQLVITGICFPFLWGVLAVWVCAKRSFLKQTMSILSASLCSLGILLF